MRCAGTFYFGHMSLGSSRKRRHEKGEGFRKDLVTAWRKMRDRTPAGHRRWLFFLFAAATLLRVAMLFKPVTHAEAVTATVLIEQPAWQVLWTQTLPENQNLHTFLVKCSVGVFGLHRWSMRLPALLAGLLCLPLFYAFARVMFNRHIALLTLAMLAGSGALIEYSALCRGYSLTWLFMCLALLAGRQFAKRDDRTSALIVALCCALGMWVSPIMVHITLAIYAWLFLYLVGNYETSLRKRMSALGLSFAAFIVFAAIFCGGVISRHGIEHYLHHPALGENTWELFTRVQGDRIFQLWDYFTDHTAIWVAVVGFAGLVQAAYVSEKYRIMVIGLLFGAIPLTMLLRAIAPVEAWTYTLFFLHLSSAIALFYLLKFIQEKMFAGFGKNMRTAVAVGAVFLLFSLLAVLSPAVHTRRFPEAASAVQWLNGLLKPGDRVFTEHPVDAPIAFEFISQGLDRSWLQQTADPIGRAWVVVAPADGQTLNTVLGSAASAIPPATLKRKMDWTLVEIWSE